MNPKIKKKELEQLNALALVSSRLFVIYMRGLLQKYGCSISTHYIDAREGWIIPYDTARV